MQKVILYLEGMYDGERGKDIRETINSKPRIRKFVENYRFVDFYLPGYFIYRKQIRDQESDSDFQVSLDIKKYLTDYQTKNKSEEENFLEKLNQLFSSAAHEKTKKEKKKSRKLGFHIFLSAAAVLSVALILLHSTGIFSTRMEIPALHAQVFTNAFTPARDEYLKEFNSRFLRMEENRLEVTGENKEYFRPENFPVTRSNSIKQSDMLLLSIYYMQEREYEAAISHLHDIVLNSTANLQHVAMYYYTIAHIALDRREEAVKYLNIIIQTDSPYKAKAGDILAAYGEN